MLKRSVEKILRKAKNSLERGKYAEAKDLCEEVLREYPDDPEAARILKEVAYYFSPISVEEVPQASRDHLIELYKKGELREVLVEATSLSSEYPDDLFLLNLIGVSAFGLGKNEDSLTAFRTLLAKNPNSPEGQNNYGDVLYSMGDFEAAALAFEKAIAYKPDFAIALNNLGKALRLLGERKKSAEAFRQALALQHDFVEAHCYLGLALSEDGELELAADAYRNAIHLQPDNFEAHFNLGLVFREMNNPDSALKSLKRAVRLAPDFVNALSNLANVQAELKDFEGASETYRKVLVLKPNAYATYFNLGLSLEAQGQPELAIEAYDKSLSIEPNFGKAHNNRGVVLWNQGRFKEAEAGFQSALLVEPNSPSIYCTLGGLLSDQGRHEGAVHAFEEAISIQSDCAEALFNLGVTKLRLGEFRRGFELYDWRWKVAAKTERFLDTKRPQWSGESGKTVFVWSEQGISDVLMFSSVLSDLIDVCAKVIFRCDSRLVPLLKRSLPSTVSIIGNDVSILEEDFDYHTPIGSIPYQLRPDLESFKSGAGSFLKADKKRSKALRNKLTKNDGRKVVGISWRGGRNKSNKARLKDIPLALLVEVFDEEKFKLVNLQYDANDEELDGLKFRTGRKIHDVHEIDKFNDLDGVAALIFACDSVVSVDNLTVHLSGGLGVETSVLLPYSCQWRWGKGAERSYWHEALILLRQDKFNQNQGKLEKLRSQYAGS